MQLPVRDSIHARPLSEKSGMPVKDAALRRWEFEEVKWSICASEERSANGSGHIKAGH